MGKVEGLTAGVSQGWEALAQIGGWITKQGRTFVTRIVQPRGREVKIFFDGLVQHQAHNDLRVKRREAETRESPEIHGPVSQAYAMVSTEVGG